MITVNIYLRTSTYLKSIVLDSTCTVYTRIIPLYNGSLQWMQDYLTGVVSGVCNSPQVANDGSVVFGCTDVGPQFAAVF